MQPNEQQLIDMLRNAKNPEKALTTAAEIIIAFLQSENVEHDIPIYNQTDTEGILKEALSNQ